MTYPDGTAEAWTYDAGGNLSSYKNRQGNHCTFQYDGRNRPVTRQWDDGW